MLANCSTSYAPWTIIEANDKYFARVKALRTVVRAIEKRL
jgi:polyphosphate kinase 2 (PPK2 family)